MMIEAVTIPRPNGGLLAGKLFYRPDIAHNQAILLCSGTGFLQKFYAPLASWLAERGYTVLTFDYQGIGESRQEPLPQCRASLASWGCQDIPTALDFLLHYSQLPQAILLGHSAGGQMLGVMHNHAKVAKVVGIATSTGHVANMRPAFARQARFLFHVYMPLNNLLFAHCKLKRINWGEDLPKAVARQWAQWCSHGDYVKTAIVRGDIDVDFHHHITQSISVIHADDDDIANAANVTEFLNLYPKANKNVLTLNPQQHGFDSIGHNLIFRPSHRALWDLILREIQLL